MEHERARGGRGLQVARAICPYLVAAEGGWRSVVASRDQQCGAVRPPAPLALDKQRRLCLTDHAACATYQAAAGLVGGEEHSSGARAEERVTRWSLVRTAPVVLDEGRIASVGRLARRRTAAQLALGALMALALGAVVLARLPGTGASPAGAVASMTPVVAAAPSRAPARTSSAPAETAAPSRSPATSPEASPPSRTSPRPAVRSYRVVAGDTLYAVAIRFNTTVQAIVDKNELSSRVLRIGQVLELP